MQTASPMTIATAQSTKAQQEHYVRITAQWIGEEAQMARAAYEAGDYDTLRECLEAIQVHAADLGYRPAARRDA